MSFSNIFLIIGVTVFLLQFFGLCFLIRNLDIAVNYVLSKIKKLIRSDNVFFIFLISLVFFRFDSKFVFKIYLENEIIAVLLGFPAIYFLNKKPQKEAISIVFKALFFVIMLRIIHNNFYRELSLSNFIYSIKGIFDDYITIVILSIKSIFITCLYLEILKIVILLFKSLNIPKRRNFTNGELFFYKISKDNKHALNVNKIKKRK